MTNRYCREDDRTGQTCAPISGFDGFRSYRIPGLSSDFTQALSLASVPFSRSIFGSCRINRQGAWVRVSSPLAVQSRAPAG
jgi:hypothetical protein